MRTGINQILSAIVTSALMVGGLAAQSFKWEVPPFIHDDNETALRPEWSIDVPLPIRRSSPILYDVTGDGNLEIIVGDLSGLLHVIDHNGHAVPGWPQNVGSPIDSTPAVGDVDGDGQIEIVTAFGTIDGGGTSAGSWTVDANGGVAAYETNGQLISRTLTSDWWNYPEGTQGPDGWSEPVMSSPAVADVDGDGMDEIVFGSMDFHIYAVNAVGGAREANADLTEFHFNTNAPAPFTNSMLRVDNDNDGRWDEDPDGDYTPFPGGDGKPGLAGVDDDGDGLIDEQGIDENGDGHVDHSLAHPHDDDEDSDNPYNATVDYSHVNEDGFEWPIFTYDTVWGSAAICDLDGDNQLDVVFPADYNINGIGYGRMRVVDRFSNPLAGWEEVLLPSLVWTPAVSGDVDGDGHPEVFMGTNLWWHTEGETWGGGHIFGLNHDATEIVDGDNNGNTFGIFGVTRQRPSNPSQGQAPFVMGAPALGDIDGDGELEIVVVDHYFDGTRVLGSLCAWNGDGTMLPGFPVRSEDAPANFGGATNTPVLADIDGDGDIEIIFLTVGAYFTAYHHDGTRVAGTPFWAVDFDTSTPFTHTGMYRFDNSPAVGDIDQDGKVEIVFASSDNIYAENGVGRIFCIEGGAYSPEGMQWPMQRGNAQGTGVYTPPAGPTHDPRDRNFDGRIDAADIVVANQQLRTRNCTQEEFDAILDTLLGEVPL